MSEHEVEQGPSAAAAIPPWILAMAMIEGWTRAEGLGSPSAAIAYLSKDGGGAPPLALRFHEAAERLLTMVPRDGAGGPTWWMPQILNELCVPFGIWIANGFARRMAGEPCWRFWFQAKLADRLFGRGNLYAQPVALVVPVVLMIRTATFEEAHVQASALLSTAALRAGVEGIWPFRRYWLLSTPAGWEGGDCWLVQAAVEVEAHGQADAYCRVETLLDVLLGVRGTGWEYGNAMGDVVRTGSMGLSPPPALSSAPQQPAGSP